MIPNQTANQAAQIAFDLLDASGNVILAVSAAWSLFDQAGTILNSGIIPVTTGATTIIIPLTAIDNTVASGSAGREIQVVLTQINGSTVEINDYFVLIQTRQLELMTNSFCTYPEALAIRTTFGPGLDGWDVNIDSFTRSSAMVDAHERLLRMTYKVPFVDIQSHIASDYALWGTGVDLPWDYARLIRLRSISLPAFQALPAPFQFALKRAQIVEANQILGGDLIANKRREGLISETIGQSSSFFSSKPYLNLPISKQAYVEVQRYVQIKVAIARG